MDKVQIYTTVLITVNLISYGVTIGSTEGREQNGKIAITIIGLLLLLPIYGRIYGVW